jgi:hypothetical protein
MILEAIWRIMESAIKRTSAVARFKASRASDRNAESIYTAALYQSLSYRRTAFDTLMWQQPAIGLAAQAFLFTIALDGGRSDLARLTAASLALVTSLVSLQTMAKHRANELTDTRILAKLEELPGLQGPLQGATAHAKPETRARAVDNPLFSTFEVRSFKSFTVWRVSLSLFAISAIGVILSSVGGAVETVMQFAQQF